MASTKTVTGTARIEAPVSLDNLYEATFKQVLDIINDNLTDPNAGSRDKWIWTTLPENKINDRDDYPRIVVSLANLTSISSITFDQKRASLNIFIYIYDTSKTQVDSLSNNLVKALDDNRSALDTDNLGSMSISSDSGDYIRSEFPVYFRSHRLGFTAEEF